MKNNKDLFKEKLYSYIDLYYDDEDEDERYNRKLKEKMLREIEERSEKDEKIREEEYRKRKDFRDESDQGSSNLRKRLTTTRNIGSAVGTVAGAGLGLGAGHLLTNNKRKEVALLTQKLQSGKISPQEKLRLDNLKRSIRKTKIIGSVAGGVIGGIGTGLILSKYGHSKVKNYNNTRNKEYEKLEGESKRKINNLDEDYNKFYQNKYDEYGRNKRRYKK